MLSRHCLRVLACSTALTSSGFRFVPEVNRLRTDSAARTFVFTARQFGKTEAARLTAARLTRLRHQLLNQVALDRTERSRPPA